MKRFLMIVSMALTGALTSCAEPGSSPSATAASAGLSDAPVRELTLTPNPSGHVPLAAEITFDAATPLDVEAVITDGEHTWPTPKQEQVSGAVSIPLVGMRADRDHTISLTVSQADGQSWTQDFVHRTPPLPASQLEFPTIDVKVADADRMEPGITFLSTRRRALGRAHWLTEAQLRFSMDWGMITAIDNDGEIVWFYQAESRTSGIDRLSNGNIVMHRADFATTEIDLLGNVVRQYYAADRPAGPPENPDAIPILNQQTLHHQPHELPDGNFLAFSANAYLVEDYPTSETDPNAPRKDQMVMADSVVIFTPEGEQIWSWDTMDYLDPYRIGYDTFWSYWWTRGFPGHVDWSHGNGLSYNAADDSILVSLRNMSAILKIDRKTKEIVWILGRHDGWKGELKDKLLTPIGDLMWPGYQHNPRHTPKGSVILFDNRAHAGRMPFEERPPYPENFSRAVEFEVDDEAMTVRQVWTTGDEQGDDPCFSYAMSDAWRLPITDNRLVISAFCSPLLPGLTQDIMDSTKRAGDDLPFGGRIVEYAGDEVVFRADVRDPDELLQWEVYGGFRSPGIYEAGSHHGGEH